MKIGNIITPYYAAMTSILKFFAIYIISRWYGISFGFPFLFLFFRIYQIIINKIYNLSSLSIIDQYRILSSILTKKIYIKEINLNSNNNKNKDEIIKIIKLFINDNNLFKRILTYKWNNFYWRQLTEKEIEKLILDKIDNKENLENKLNKNINILKEPSYKFFLIEKDSGNLKIIIKFNSLINEKYVDILKNYINDNNMEKKNKRKINKLIKLILDFIFYPIQLFLEILVILFLAIKAI